jgi:hypothetical protein
VSTKLRKIAIDESNYLTLKQLGSAGDSFNDVLTDLLRQANLQAGGGKGLRQSLSLYPDGEINICPIGCQNNCPKFWINNDISHRLVCVCSCHESVKQKEKPSDGIRSSTINSF